MFGQVRVVIAMIPGDFFTEPLGFLKLLITMSQFNFSQDKPCVGTQEHVDLIAVLAHGDEDALLLNGAWLAESEQFQRFRHLQLLLPLIATDTGGIADALDRHERQQILNPDAYGALWRGAQITLLDLQTASAGVQKIQVLDQELAFNFTRHDKPQKTAAGVMPN